MLETTECIPINNMGKTYTDCMEFSLLRFVHMLMFNPNEMLLDRYSTYPSNINCKQYLKDFFEIYPKIHPDAEYYLKDGLGIDERNKWSTLVSDKECLDYYRNDMAELFTSIVNLIKFINEFFNKDYSLDENNVDFVLEEIGKDFSTQDKKISLSINSIDTVNYKMKMNEIIRYVSRPENEYQKYLNSNKIFDITKKTTLMKLSINEYEYEWMMLELIINNNEELNKYITGHSVIKHLF